MAGLTASIRRWRDNRSGSFAVYAALALPVMLGALGFGLDYVQMLSHKSRLDAAADNAALAAVHAANAYQQSNPRKLTGTDLTVAALSAGDAAGALAFKANAAATLDVAPLTPAVKTVFEGGAFNSVVSYATTRPVGLAGLLGVTSIPLQGVAKAQQQPTTFIKIYFLIDNSQSMGIGANQEEMTRIANAWHDHWYADRVAKGLSTSNVESCVFACHQRVNNEVSGYDIAREAKATMRIDTARQAIYNLARSAQMNSREGNVQFDVTTMTRLTTNAADALGYITHLWPTAGVSASDYANLMQNMTPDSRLLDLSEYFPWQPPYSSSPGDSNQTRSIEAFAKTLPASGDGTSAKSPINYVFIVTDGIINSPPKDKAGVVQTDTPCKMSPTAILQWFCTLAMPATDCDPLKANGATVGVLYTTYLTIYKNNDPAQGLDELYTKWVKPYIGFVPGNLKACSSGEGWYYEASDDVGLLNGMNKLLASTMKFERLTQ